MLQGTDQNPGGCRDGHGNSLQSGSERYAYPENFCIGVPSASRPGGKYPGTDALGPYTTQGNPNKIYNSFSQLPWSWRRNAWNFNATNPNRGTCEFAGDGGDCFCYKNDFNSGGKCDPNQITDSDFKKSLVIQAANKA